MSQRISFLPLGVHPVIYSLFNANGELDRQAMKRQIEVCVSQGAVGIVALGLATEVRFLDQKKQRQIVEWSVADIAGRVPLGVTIFAQTPEKMIERVHQAKIAGADWVILQPPANVTDAQVLQKVFSRTLEECHLPAALQNMPQFIGVGLTVKMIAELAKRHDNLVAVKQEVSAIEIAELILQLGGHAQVLSGRGGIELVDCMAAGVSGHIPAPEYADILVRLWDSMKAGRESEAKEIYARFLPLATFILQSVDSLTTYGKLLFCLRNGIDFYQRTGADKPTRFGLDLLMAHAQWAGIQTGEWAVHFASILENEK
jgi:2-keto-3-deoxy-L-arabinonate dehydratase|tara:strand:- start:1259 stop:2203 length:945 start_codon:yes stop_codon:yes gene_type:complete